MSRRLAVRPRTTSRSRSPEAGVEVGGAREAFLGEEPGLDAAGQLDLLGGGEQRDAADLAQVLPEQVGGGAAGVRAAAGVRGSGRCVASTMTASGAVPGGPVVVSGWCRALCCAGMAAMGSVVDVTVRVCTGATSR